MRNSPAVLITLLPPVCFRHIQEALRRELRVVL